MLDIMLIINRAQSYDNLPCCAIKNDGIFRVLQCFNLCETWSISLKLNGADSGFFVFVCIFASHLYK